MCCPLWWVHEGLSFGLYQVYLSMLLLLHWVSNVNTDGFIILSFAQLNILILMNHASSNTVNSLRLTHNDGHCYFISAVRHFFPAVVLTLFAKIPRCLLRGHAKVELRCVIRKPRLFLRNWPVIQRPWWHFYTLSGL